MSNVMREDLQRKISLLDSFFDGMTVSDSDFYVTVVKRLSEGTMEHGDDWATGRNNLEDAIEECLDSFNYVLFVIELTQDVDIADRLRNAAHSLYDTWNILRSIKLSNPLQLSPM